MPELLLQSSQDRIMRLKGTNLTVPGPIRNLHANHGGTEGGGWFRGSEGHGSNGVWGGEEWFRPLDHIALSSQLLNY